MVEKISHCPVCGAEVDIEDLIETDSAEADAACPDCAEMLSEFEDEDDYA